MRPGGSASSGNALRAAASSANTVQGPISKACVTCGLATLIDRVHAPARDGVSLGRKMPGLVGASTLPVTGAPSAYLRVSVAVPAVTALKLGISVTCAANEVSRPTIN